MEDNIKQRLIMFLKHLGIGQGKFEKNTDIGNGTVNNIKDGIGSPKLAKIITCYPELNIKWLLTGEGKMLNTHIQTDGLLGTDNKPVSTNIDFLLNMLNRQEQQLSSQQNAIAEKDKTIAEKDRIIISQQRTIEALSLKTPDTAGNARIAGAEG
jgi:hypothetical protein